MITGNLNVIPVARVRNIISKGPKYRFPSNIDFPKCRNEIAASLNDFGNHWYKWENVEPDALKEWKINIFSSPQPKAQSKLIGWDLSRRPSIRLSISLFVCLHF